ncbi:MAG: ThiF family adenylyltransferase [Brevundimonas sp.]|nr:ThiF family adenylyltransferase [Brevundimonas sp.]MDO9589031.1 ThiF family adenylyltransferase [Brevundimonas sp.]
MSARAESAKMLASLMGVDPDEAAERLDRKVLITASVQRSASGLAAEVVGLLERTLAITDEPDEAHIELVIGDARPRSEAPLLYAAADAAGVVVGSAQIQRGATEAHPLVVVIYATAVSAAVLRAVAGDGALPHGPDPLEIKASQLGLPDLASMEPLDLTGAVLVGAGAVGHGFVRALRTVPVFGELIVLDPKTVGGGNLNRCLYLQPEDEGRDKAVALAERAAPDFPDLRLTPEVAEFRRYAEAVGRVDTAIVTVDSRRARRSIQEYAPRRVFDASTTDVTAVVVHAHQQPTGGACMACIYRHIPDEQARERSIAEGLGIDLGMLGRGFIDEEAATRILQTHPGLDRTDLVGKAFDTLFRQLCATQALTTTEGRQVLTPFAFVSSLAGALIVVEMLRRAAGMTDTNYWQIDPWLGPLARLRKHRSRAPDCSFCSRPEAVALVKSWWG